MLSTEISQAATPNLAWGARRPGLIAIVVQALRDAAKPARG